jgi:hypothetical protein
MFVKGFIVMKRFKERVVKSFKEPTTQMTSTAW